MRWTDRGGSAWGSSWKRSLPALACALLAISAVFGAISLACAADVPAANGAISRGRFVVVLDPAHGGTDTGARLSNQLLEKDFDLKLASALRAKLLAHNIGVVTTRNSDVTLPAIDRAEIANRTGAQACITLHATTSGTGIHLFTSSLAPVPLIRFLPWNTAQGAYVQRSLRLASEINTAFTKERIPVILGSTALEPLDSFTCPAAAVEAAPLVRSGDRTPLSDTGYQKRIVDALASALIEWRQDWARGAKGGGRP